MQMRHRLRAVETSQGLPGCITPLHLSLSFGLHVLSVFFRGARVCLYRRFFEISNEPDVTVVQNVDASDLSSTCA